MLDLDLDRAALADPAAPEWDGLLQRALTGEGVRAVFQPIIDVGRRVVTGYEALARFDLAAGLTPDRWFAAAAVRELVPALEATTLRAALSHRDDLPPNCFLTLNVEPESIAAPEVTGLLTSLPTMAGLVIEVTEHRAIEDPVRFDAMLDQFRTAGALIAVDDAGAGHAGLQQILLLRPSILKLDRALIEGIDADEAKTALAEMLGLFANRVDAWLLAEGVETLAEARRVEELSIPLAQGYLYARPGAPWVELDPAVRQELRDASDAASGGGLHGLISPSPTVLVGYEMGAARSFGGPRPITSGPDVVVVVDETSRPVGLMTPDSALTGSVVEAFRANVSTTPAELASRLTTRVPADTTTPVLVTDNAGRYLGVVTVARLLGHLASLR